jgi:hypothetical protein
MKIIVNSLLFLLILASSSITAQEDPFDPVFKAVRESDAGALATSFNATVELSLPDSENTCSVSQGEMIMKDFFKKYPPDSLTLIRKGIISEYSHYAICSYKSGDRLYQVYFDLRQEKGRFLIYKIKFEENKK